MATRFVAEKKTRFVAEKKTCFVATRFVAKKKTRFVATRFVAEKKNSFRGIAAALTTSFVIAEPCIFLQISTLIFHLVYRHILTFWSQETPYWTKIR